MSGSEIIPPTIMKYYTTVLLSSLAIVSAQYGSRYQPSNQKTRDPKYTETWKNEPRYETSSPKTTEQWEEKYVAPKIKENIDESSKYEAPKYVAPKIKSIYEGPKYEAPIVKSIYEGPKYEAPIAKSIYEGPKYEAPNVKSINEGPKYVAPIVKSIYEGPKYEAPNVKSINEGPKYVAPIVKYINEGPKYEAPKVIKSIYEGSNYDAPKIKSDTVNDRPKYEAPKLKEYYEHEVPVLKTPNSEISNYEDKKYEVSNLEESIEGPKEELNKRPGVIQLQYQEPRIVTEEEINDEIYHKQMPLILGRFRLGFDKRTATSNGLMRPLTLDQLRVVGKNYWGRCRGIYKDGAYAVKYCDNRDD